MEQDFEIQKQLAFNSFQQRGSFIIQEINFSIVHTQLLKMAFNVFFCILHSKSAKDNIYIFRDCTIVKNKYKLNFIELYKKIESFVKDLDQNIKDRLFILKIQDQKIRINKFCKDYGDFWDQSYMVRTTWVCADLVRLSNLLLKLWEIKFGMQILNIRESI